MAMKVVLFKLFWRFFTTHSFHRFHVLSSILSERRRGEGRKWKFCIILWNFPNFSYVSPYLPSSPNKTTMWTVNRKKWVTFSLFFIHFNDLKCEKHFHHFQRHRSLADMEMKHWKESFTRKRRRRRIRCSRKKSLLHHTLDTLGLKSLSQLPDTFTLCSSLSLSLSYLHLSNGHILSDCRVCWPSPKSTQTGFFAETFSHIFIL